MDSLWGVWNNTNQEDTIRLKAMHKIAWYGYLFSKPDSAFYCAQLMYEMANENGLIKYKAISLNVIGVYYFYKGNYEKAIESYEKSIKFYEESGYQRGKANALGNIANVFVNQANYPKAIKFYLQREAYSKMAKLPNHGRFLKLIL